MEGWCVGVLTLSEQRRRQRFSRQLVNCLQLLGESVVKTVEGVKGAAGSDGVNDYTDPELWVESKGESTKLLQKTSQ